MVDTFPPALFMQAQYPDPGAANRRTPPWLTTARPAGVVGDSNPVSETLQRMVLMR